MAAGRHLERLGGFLHRYPVQRERSVDTSFGTSGIATSDFGVIDFLMDMAIQPTAKFWPPDTRKRKLFHALLAMVRLNTTVRLTIVLTVNGRVASLITDFEEANYRRSAA